MGLRADKQNPSSPTVQLQHIETWQEMWPRLAIVNRQVFEISALTSEESVRHLLNSIDQECDKMFTLHTMEIPTLYRATLEKIRSDPTTSKFSLVNEDDLYTAHGNAMDRQLFSSIIQYFHAIGSLVCLKNRLVCTDPQSIPKIAAKFVSPEQVRLMLLREKI